VRFLALLISASLYSEYFPLQYPLFGNISYAFDMKTPREKRRRRGEQQSLTNSQDYYEAQLERIREEGPTSDSHSKQTCATILENAVLWQR
jgi:hypothetical protein